MVTRLALLKGLAFAGALLLLPHVSSGQSANEQIAQRIADTQTSLASKSDSDEIWKDSKPQIANYLAKARESLKAGRTYKALAELEVAFTIFGSADNAASNPAIVKAGLPAFDAEWARSEASLKPLEQRYSAGNWSATPAIVRAIAELDWSQSRVMYRTARDFGDATDAESGLYYLGRSKATIDFALFSRNLRFPQPAPQPSIRSVAGEIEHLEDRVLAAYQPPFSIDHHADFIRINAELKVAREMDAANLYYAALYRFLNASDLFGSLTAPPVDSQRAELLRAEATKIRSQIVTSAADHSIAQLFLERAESSLETSDVKELKAAQVRLEQVIPAYFAAIGKAEPLTVARGNPVTITLVRWPYT